MKMEILRVENLSFSYSSAATIRGVTFQVMKGEFVAIEGRSGSGKSTLFYLLGGLLRPQSGKVLVDGEEITHLSNDELAFARNRKIGFVFQQFHLLAKATVLENILLPTLYPCEMAHDNKGAKRKARALAEKLGIGHLLSHLPNQLSGGEQQRVAIARALMTDAPLVLADEPTGNLDSATAALIIDLLKDLCTQGKTVVLITHDGEVARRCSRRLRMQDGALIESGEKVDFTENHSSPVLHSIRSAAGYSRLAKSVAPLAMENLRRNKVRAVLTMAGVTIGIAALFAMITFGEFAKSQILKGYEELGANTVMMRGHSNDRRKASDKVDVLFQFFDWEKDLLPLTSVFPDVKYLSPLLMSWEATANFGGNRVEKEVNVLGVSAEYNGILNRPLASGRTITPHHIANRSPVCLIGPELSTKLFRHESPLGQILFISRDDQAYPCQVIGVLKEQTSANDWRKPNLEVVLPFTYFRAVNGWWESQIHRFVVQMEAGRDVEKVAKGIRTYFEQKYGTSGEFRVDSNSLLIGQMRKFIGLFTLLLSMVALVTLAVGGVGINNMMLVSLSERFKEIGLRKAMGATDRTVRVQLLLESTLLSAMAGIAGIVLGFAGYEIIIYIASRFVSSLGFRWILDPTALLVSSVAMLAVGIASGFTPALKAERLQVIEALRSE